MYDNPYDRMFGIEFEFNIPNLRHIRDDYGYNSKHKALRNLLSENGMKDFSVGADGSEFEVRTPPLSGPNGFKRVKNFLDLVTSIGGRASLNSDGLHVHHDAPEFVGNMPRIIRIVENWVENQDEIFKLVNSRRHYYGPCPAWNEDDLNTLRESDTLTSGYYGRKNLNIMALNRHGTIEIRLHEGTLDYETVFSWVRFGQAFIAKALDETSNVLDRATSPSDLLRKIKVSRNASRFIAEKVQNNYGSVWA